MSFKTATVLPHNFWPETSAHSRHVRVNPCPYRPGRSLYPYRQCFGGSLVLLLQWGGSVLLPSLPKLRDAGTLCTPFRRKIVRSNQLLVQASWHELSSLLQFFIEPNTNPAAIPDSIECPIASFVMLLDSHLDLAKLQLARHCLPSGVLL